VTLLLLLTAEKFSLITPTAQHFTYCASFHSSLFTAVHKHVHSLSGSLKYFGCDWLYM